MRVFIFSIIVLTLVVLAILSVSSNYPLTFSTHNPTAREIIKENPNADIIKLDGLVYSNVSDQDRIREQNILVGEKIGEVKKKSSSTWWYQDFYATKLPTGTEIYTIDEDSYEKGDAPFYILVKQDEKIFIYQALIEG
ncbi:hypothetical protein SAMN05216389_106205 [Oceanobacillus limi]|uniref:Uncharacterized protein n=1 Tax=Oceanobacillus limi TaxID=930131 RepID=A0A1I0CGQ9_9BACI|nr:hypothetical protein [Oceanobacillus limi]SET18284.1 hypothetical protein SAMN05216389_106205 [Oceanobacillus limi]